jgi:hypothetical protein
MIPVMLSISNSSLSFADVSEDDIELVMEQAQVNRAQAIKALQDHGYARLHLALSKDSPVSSIDPRLPCSDGVDAILALSESS